MKSNNYNGCVESAMLYDSETWLVNLEDTYRLQRTEMQMARWMCSISLSEQRPSKEKLDRLGIQDMSVVMQQMRLRCFCQIERMATEKLVSKYRSLVINSAAGRGRPRKTWNQVVKNDLETLQLEKHSLKNLMDGEMPSRNHHSTHASKERILNEKKNPVTGKEKPITDVKIKMLQKFRKNL